MQNNENSSRRGPKRGPGGRNFEKPKDFKSSMKRLLKELKPFRVLIILAIVLSTVSSILSIFAPNMLSDLTDEITKGLVVNSKNLEKVTNTITNSFDEESMKEELPKILSIDLSQNKIMEIMSNPEIPQEDKVKMQENLSTMDSSNSLTVISQLPESIQKVILKDSTYKGSFISTLDKLKFLDSMIKMANSDKQNIDLPDSIMRVFISEFQIDGIAISIEDQLDFLQIAKTLDKDMEAEKLYKKMDEMPENIKKVIEPTMNMDKIKKISLFLAILYLCSALFNYIESISMTVVSNNFARKLRSRISDKINSLPLKYFDNHLAGDILSRVTNDIDTIAQSMNQSLSTLVSALALFIGTIIMMFYTNWIMALTAILASLFGFIFMFIILGKSQKYFIARQKELGALNGHIEEVYSGLNVVKVYNGKKESDEVFDRLNEEVYDANRKSQFLSGLMMPMMNFIGNFGYVAVCIVGALLTLNDSISFGVIVAFISYVRLFTSPLSQIAQAMTSLQSTAAAGERVFELLDEEQMKDEKEITKLLSKEKAKGNITFNHVSFTYDGNKEPTIKDFSAKATSGQKIAIVGPTGAGKTTMVNLLMKFYDISSGDIKIDGVSIKDLTRENIHDLFTMVLQDTWLFNGTVKENIIYNREHISDERVKEVCKTVGLDHFIRTLPNGYNSDISNNDSVSAGQRQLLTIARGMIEDAPFLILDEATSNVDTRTEELVQKAMDKLTEGKTSFIIAHRLSTIKNADLILVMKDGNIIEQGNHDELMKKEGFYADLYNSQFEL